MQVSIVGERYFYEKSLLGGADIPLYGREGMKIGLA